MLSTLRGSRSFTASSNWATTPSFASLDSNVLHTSMSTTNSGSDYLGDESASMESIQLPQQELTDRAVTVVQRVLDKLTGMDFQDHLQQTASTSSAAAASHKPLAISEQIDRLINEATSNDNLSTCYMGWCPLW